MRGDDPRREGVGGAERGDRPTARNELAQPVPALGNNYDPDPELVTRRITPSMSRARGNGSGRSRSRLRRTLRARAV